LIFKKRYEVPKVAFLHLKSIVFPSNFPQFSLRIRYGKDIFQESQYTVVIL